jgi:cell wall-associated NlpC family hydrolase
MHWSENYIGKPYRLGDADCAALVCEVREQQFDGTVPDFVLAMRENTRLKRVEQLESLAREAVTQTDKPTEGDVVLMLCRGRPSHVGVYCVVDNEPSVLHAMENAKMVVRHRIRDLEKFWLKVEGYYKWN